MLGIAAPVLTVDQASKSLVVAAAPDGVVSVRLMRNTGASFGIGAGHPVQVTLVAVVVLAVAAVLLGPHPQPTRGAVPCRRGRRPGG